MTHRILPLLGILTFFATACTNRQTDNINQETTDSCQVEKKDIIHNPPPPSKVPSNAAWVRKLKQQNPNKDSLSIYFKFDTIINHYEVSGIAYPFWYGDDTCAQRSRDYTYDAVYYFHNLQTDKTYTYTTYEDIIGKHNYYIDNLRTLQYSEGFDGYHDGDAYLFQYNRSKYAGEHVLCYAEYQFFDADFDGEDELIISYISIGPRFNTLFEIYDITDEGLVGKKEISEERECLFQFDNSSDFDSVRKTISFYIFGGCDHYGEYLYQYDKNGQLHYICHIDHDYLWGSFCTDTTFYSKWLR